MKNEWSAAIPLTNAPTNLFSSTHSFLSDLENKYTTVNALHFCFISSGKNELCGLNSSSVKLDRVRNIYQNKHALSVKIYTKLNSGSGYLSGDTFVRSSRRISRIPFRAEKGNYLTIRVAIIVVDYEKFWCMEFVHSCLRNYVFLLGSYSY